MFYNDREAHLGWKCAVEKCDEVPFGAAVLKFSVGTDGKAPLKAKRVFALEKFAQAKMRVVPRSLCFTASSLDLGTKFFIFAHYL